MSNPVVSVLVNIQEAPAPSTLQRTGAFLSQGGTNTSQGTKTFLATSSALTPFLAAALALSSLSWSSGVATAVGAATTIASGTYNGTSGLVTLTLAAGIGLAAGSLVVVGSVTGTGSYASVDGSYTAAVGSGGTTLEYTIGTGLTLTITGGTVTIGHGVTVGDQFLTTIAGAVPAVYNGTVLATATMTTAFTYQLASDGGTTPATGTITYTPRNQAELGAMNTTFFANGIGPGANVLELGAGEVNAGVTFLTTWIAQNPNVFYSYLVPRSWDGNASFLAFLATFDANNSKTYFFVTTTLQNYLLYAGLKCVVALIEAPYYGTWTANALTALSQTGGAATATTTTNHGILPNQWFQLSGNAPSGWNGWFKALPGTATNSIAFAVPSTLGAETVLGTLVQSQYASAGVPPTEFSAASVFWVTLNYNPSGTNQVTPLNQGYLFGVTAFPIAGNASLLSTLATANVNIVGTGAAGGNSNTLVQGGNNEDGNPFNFWYSVDWVQINCALQLTAYIINGANNPQAPVYYDQPGINGGQTVLAGVMGNGITDGLVLQPVKMTQLDAADFTAALDADTYSGYTVVNADPFPSYTAENPTNYAAGIYNGYSIDYVPKRGFASITIQLNVSNFPT